MVFDIYLRGKKNNSGVYLFSTHTHTHHTSVKDLHVSPLTARGGKDGDQERRSHIPQARILTAEGAVAGASG